MCLQYKLESADFVVTLLLMMSSSGVQNNQIFDSTFVFEVYQIWL